MVLYSAEADLWSGGRHRVAVERAGEALAARHVQAPVVTRLLDAPADARPIGRPSVAVASIDTGTSCELRQAITVPILEHAVTSLADFLQILRLRKALIVLILALVLVTTLVVTAFLPKWYLATTKIRVEKPESEVKLFQTQTSNYYDPYFLQDQFRIIQSEKIARTRGGTRGPNRFGR